MAWAARDAERSGIGWRIGAGLGMVVGVALTAFGAFYLGSNFLFWLRAETALGRVERTSTCAGPRGRVFACGDILYSRADGTSGWVESAPRTGPVGTTIKVLYDPAKPDGARSNDFLNLWGGPLFALAFGGFWLFLSVRDFLAWRRRRSPP